MTMELRDLRAKISVEADAAIDAAHLSSGKDRSEIVRDVLHAWALARIDESRLLLRRLSSEGITERDSGTQGSGRL
jgi:hypothetical protein